MAQSQVTQAQDSLEEQLKRLVILANKNGLYDAADFLRYKVLKQD